MASGKFGPPDPMNEWSRRIQDIMDEMRNRSFCDYRTAGGWLPTVNIYETRAAYYLCVELAGIDPATIAVECPDPQHVRVSGQRVRPAAPGLDLPFSIDLMEIDEGPFLRDIDFTGVVDVNAIETSYDCGYFWITLRKVEAP
jgi:HSP20 family molecular chaperone IbpA